MKPVRNWLPAFAALGAVMILGLSAIAAQRISAVHRASVRSQLTAHTETLTNLLQVMQHNFLEASRSMARAPELVDLAKELADRPGDAEARTNLEAWTSSHLSTYGFSQYSVFDRDLTIVAAHDPVYLGARSKRFDYFAQLNKDDFGISYPFRTRRTTAASAGAGKRDYIQLACHTIRSGSRLLGYFCIGSDPRQQLFPLLNGSWAGKSGEAYLIDRDGRLRTPSRFESSFAGDPEPVDELHVSRLSARVPKTRPAPGEPLAVPAPNAPLTDLAEQLIASPMQDIRLLEGYTDYRGRRVVGAGKWLPAFDLGLVIEMDEEEVFGSAALANLWVFGLAVTAVAILILLTIKDTLARRDLAIREAQMASFFANAPMSMHIQDRNGAFLRVNPEYRRVAQDMGDPVEGPGETDWSRVREHQREQVFQSGEAMQFDIDYTDQNGRDRSIHVVRFPIKLKGSQELLGVGSVGIDITSEVEARRELEQLAARLESDVAARTSELRKARDVAEEAGRAKAEFLANMSHEIRTPLNAISGMSHLATRLNTEPRIAHYLERIETAGSHLLAIVNEILDFSKIEAEKLQLTLAPFSPKQVLDDVVALTAPRIGNRNLDLLVTVEPGVPELVVGDAMRISQILINFASNAIKFTEEGTVEIRLSCGGRELSNAVLRFDVSDSGRGIPADQLEQLFQPFTQLDSTRSRSHEGTGLGLAISKRLAELMGGDVRASSKPGEGSTFTLELPLAVASGAITPSPSRRVRGKKRVLVVDNHDRAGRHTVALLEQMGFSTEIVASLPEALERLSGRERNPFALLLVDARCDADGSGARHSGTDAQARRILLLSPGTEPPAFAANYDGWLHKPLTEAMVTSLLAPVASAAPIVKSHSAAKGASLEGLKVLLVEDNEVNCEVAVDLLATRGVSVQVARDGMQALHVIAPGRFDVVLMDVHMPVFDGIETTKSLRMDPSLRDLPIIGLSASVQPAEQAKAFAAGMNAFVSKPIVPQDLFAALESWSTPSTSRSRTSTSVSETISEADDALISRLQAGSGLDIEHALSLVLNRTDLYAKLVRRVVSDQAVAPEALMAAMDAGEIDTAARIAHNLGSIAGSLGAAALRRECIALEAELREGKTSNERLSKIVADLGHLHAALAAAVA